MNTFDCQEFPDLHGRSRPSFWAGWSPWRRAEWVVENAREQKVSIDLFGAMARLKASGDWPADEDLGLVNGRAMLPPMVRRVPGRACAPAVAAPGKGAKKAAHHGVKQRGAERPAEAAVGKAADFWWRKY